ncbi:metallophosphoesterase family protein [Thalassobacillus sp. B23F22_16]|uniref:metallophosphoesterase family protein n=1 Tax=Thalassobacillus sp. B23F22_16 TaxID=3459513 RepID=UPI00373FBFC1
MKTKPHLKFIHCADLHIDSPFKGVGELPPPLNRQVRESTFFALDRLVDLAVTHEVDFVLMSGDLFDEEIRSLRAQIKLRDAFRKLKENGIKVFASHGNHDYLSADFHHVTYPDNVHVFKEEQVTHEAFSKNGEIQAIIYGFSYHNRAVKERKAAEYIRTADHAYHIAMLHGSIETNTEHDVYAPFRLGELQEKMMDYWALGHIHKRTKLAEDPPIIYPGNIQGRSIKEPCEKGCYLVEMGENGTNLTFLPLQAFRFETFHLSTKAESFDELEQVITTKKEEWRNTGPAIIHLHITGGEGLATLRHHHQEMEELVEIINEQEQSEDQWLWIRKVDIEAVSPWDEGQLMQEKHFVGEMLRQFQQAEEMDDWLKPLYRHRKARKHLEVLREEEKEQVMQEAKDLLLMELLKR